MLESLIALGGLAVVDSINPSALVVTLILLSGQRPCPKVVAYVIGIFTAYLTIGILLMLGLDVLFTRWGDALWSPGAVAVQGALGAAMLIYSFIADSKAKGGRFQEASTAKGLAALFLLGATITAAELTTAMPYFGAVGLLTYLNLPTPFWLLLLFAYNLVFVAPPLLLLLAHRFFSQRLADRFASLQARLQRAGRETALWIVGIVGFFLAIDALYYFDFFGLLEVDLPNGARSPSEMWWQELNQSRVAGD